MKKLILASGSPRRRELLAKCDIPFEVITSNVPEESTETAPSRLVMDLSHQKASAVQTMLQDDQTIILGADTVVAYQGKILGKPADEADACRMLKMLSDATHQVYTGVTLLQGSRCHSFFACTDVTFYPLSDREIQDYIATKDPLDKAGAYGIQGPFARYVKGINGDYNNVVGLPLSMVYHELEDFFHPHISSSTPGSSEIS
jgi:septum formation protein